MDILRYEELTGTTVEPANILKYEKAIIRTQVEIEDILGYSLAIQTAPTTREFYEVNFYNVIDPVKNITNVKLIDHDGGETVVDDYIKIDEKGYTKAIRLLAHCLYNRFYFKLSVTGSFAFDTHPNELEYIWIDRVDYILNPKKHLKSETLATHSYTRELEPDPYEKDISILSQWVGRYGRNRILKIV